MKTQVILPLFWKFTIAIVITVGVFGFINLYFLSTYVSDLFEKELSDNGLIMAKTVAERSVEYILYNDLAALNRLVTELKLNDKNIAYTFILDAKNHVLAHTFDNNVPTKLISLVSLNKIQTIKLIFNDSLTTAIRDISVPILESNLGTVRLGFYEDNYLKTINIAKSFFLGLVVLFLIVGIVGAFVFSYIITKPISILSKMAKKINLSDFEVTPQNREQPNFISNWNKKLKIYDEIDDLLLTFNKMIIRLQRTYTKLQSTRESPNAIRKNCCHRDTISRTGTRNK